jgi:hypothetical protein
MPRWLRAAATTAAAMSSGSTETKFSIALGSWMPAESSVCTTPGRIALTCIRCGRNSSRSAYVNPTTPNLVAQ